MVAARTSGHQLLWLWTTDSSSSVWGQGHTGALLGGSLSPLPQARRSQKWVPGKLQWTKAAPRWADPAHLLSPHWASPTLSKTQSTQRPLPWLLNVQWELVAVSCYLSLLPPDR